MRLLKDDRGQATIAALIIIPLALSIFCALILTGFALVFEARATSACRVSLYKSQQNAADALESLLELNTTARALELTRKAAKIALKAAYVSGVPYAVPAARAALFAAELAQEPVRLAQKYYLLQGRQNSYLAPIRAASAVTDSLPEGFFKRAVLGALQNPTRISVPRFQKASFAVIASSTDERTPTYRTAPDFEKRQIASARWLLSLNTPKLKFDSDVPVPANFDVNENRSLKIELGCTVALKKRGNGKWEPQITEDRLLSNSSSSSFFF